MDAVVQEAEDRNEHLIRTIDSYVEVRRGTIASRPAFAIFELELDIPDEVYHHPVLESLRLGAIDMICIGNVSNEFLPYSHPPLTNHCHLGYLLLQC